jgi:hypothetical protein
MKCDAHSHSSDCIGEIEKVEVVRKESPSQFWTFNYCQEAIWADKQRGFTVKRISEEDKP